MRVTIRPSIAVLFFIVLLSYGAYAQIPRTISFQGVLADATGKFLPDGNHSLEVTIYDNATGGTALFTETQTVAVLRGVFNMIIGGTTPGGITSTVQFDKAYFLGIKVDGGSELTPRTPMTSVPYSLHASLADSAGHAGTAATATLATRALAADSAKRADTASFLRGGAVTSINGRQGAVTLTGTGGTTVSQTGNQITINSGAGGGIQEIINTDNSIGIVHATGPVVDLQLQLNGVRTEHIQDAAVTTAKIAPGAIVNDKLADNSVTSSKIADGEVKTGDLANNAATTQKISTQGATAIGQALTYNGSLTPVWQFPYPSGPAGGDLTGTYPDPQIAPSAVTTPKIADAAVTLPKISSAGATANGQALMFNGTTLQWGFPTASSIVLPFAGTVNSASPAFRIDNTGTGVGILGIHSASTGTSSGVRGETNSQDANANALIGVVNSTSPGGFSAGVRGINNGTGGLGIGVYGSHGGSGWGVYGTSPGGIGVHGNSSNGFGVYALSTSGTASYGLSTNGESGRFEITNSGNGSDALIGATNGGGAAIHGSTTGSGRAGFFEISNSGSVATALDVATNGIGNGISVRLTNASNGGRGIDVTQSGVGPGVFATSAGGNAVWGITSSISAAGVIGDNTFGEAVVGRNRGGNGVGAVVGRNDSSGYGVRGFNTKNGIGVLGQAGISGGTGVAGRFENVNAANISNTAEVSTNGIGNGISVQLTNASNGGRGVDVNQAGVGPGVFATSAGGNAVWGITSSISAAGVIGDNTFGEAVVGRNRGGNGVGAVVGRNDSSGYGVRGFNTKNGIGVLGQAGISGGTGTAGRFENVNAANTSEAVEVATNGIGSGISVQLTNASNGARGIDVTQSGVGPGVFATSAGGNAVWGITSSISAAGVIGDNTFGEAVVGRNRGGNGVGAVVGRNDSSGYGVRGFNTKNGYGVLGQAGISGGTGTAGRFENVNAANTSDALQVVTNSAGNAARFTGNVVINGNLTVSGTVAKGGGSFRIDHPLDPENKYLYHSFVESPDMMNVYNGVIKLDEHGEAWVELPEWFQALNRDFRYQLTPIGAPGPNLFIAEEVHDNRFKIAGGNGGAKVSWQVTGIRHDTYANEHRIQVEVEKSAEQRGRTVYRDVESGGVEPVETVVPTGTVASDTPNNGAAPVLNPVVRKTSSPVPATSSSVSADQDQGKTAITPVNKEQSKQSTVNPELQSSSTRESSQEK